MIYIVSGYMRTGTSMMMRALSAGGLEPSFNKARNRLNENFGDDSYRPNPEGFYELTPKEYRSPDFPSDGKLIKLLITDKGAIKAVEKVSYKVVFMLRHPEEIRQSFEGFWGDARQVLQVVKNYHEIMRKAISRFKASAKSVTVLQYRDVVENPLDCFESLDWPIDPEKAASVIDPKLCRFRLEDLEVGI